MNKLLQHASRSLPANVSSITSLARPFHHVASSACLPCLASTIWTPLRNDSRAALSFQVPQSWARRSISSFKQRLDDRTPSDSRPMPMPPPASHLKPVPRGQVEDTAPEVIGSLEGQERLQEESDSLLERGDVVEKTGSSSEDAPTKHSTNASQERLQENPTRQSMTGEVHDNVTRVPDEHLPSHREKQRWNLSKRLSEAMDDLLPKLAVVTQKVNTYTGTDYSGVEALRREIMEQEKLVRARRVAIDTAKHTLDIATSQQASAQKEVVALLERKHSWSASDLERYMSLIRSEHVNDQAVREAKEAVFSAESALEEARTMLEKRERAQYHEEQIWSDTIRRNSTWVTFGLMGVNIFLLLLSLLILEPWRRRRMVREIKTALEAQKTAMDITPITAVPAVGNFTTDAVAAIEAEIDGVIDSEAAEAEPGRYASTPEQNSMATEPTYIQHVPVAEVGPEVSKVSNLPEASTTTAHPDTKTEPALLPSAQANTLPRPTGWQDRATALAQDIVSDRVISMRRIDYTTSILQGAAAGAVITAAIIAMLQSA